MNRFSGNGNGRQNSQSRPQQRQSNDEEQYQDEGDGGNGSRQPPAATLIIGNMRCVIWENESKDGKWYSVSLTRSYRTGGEKGEWKQATTLGKNDCLVGAELLRMALHKIVELSGGR